MSYPVEFAVTFHNQPSLTLNAKLYNSAGAQTGSTITTGFVNLGNGVYSYLATIPDGHVGTLVVYDSATPSHCYGFAINSVELELNALADAILKRSVANVEASASTHSLAEVILAMFESAAPSTTWTIYRTDHSTVFNTRTLTTDADALPVTGVN